MLKTNKYLNYSDIIGYSWNLVISNIWLFIRVALVYIIVLGALVGGQFYTETLMPRTHGPELAELTYGLFSILGNVIAVVMAMGFLSIIFALFDGEKACAGMLLRPRKGFWSFIFAGILYYIIILLGTLLFVVPGIIWSVKFSLVFFFVVDKGLGPVQALKASARATACMKWHWLGLMAVSSMIMFAGVLCLGIGALISYPVGYVAMALGYRQLAAQTPELEEFGIKTMFEPQTSAPAPASVQQPVYMNV
jgi:hypothetical protein